MATKQMSRMYRLKIGDATPLDDLVFSNRILEVGSSYIIYKRGSFKSEYGLVTVDSGDIKRLGQSSGGMVFPEHSITTETHVYEFKEAKSKNYRLLICKSITPLTK